MRYSFRLAELLGHVPDPRKRPGTIKAIVEYTGLDRHQVAALLKNEVKYIPLKALSRICDYLIEHGHASADQLPGALFAVEPENFWDCWPADGGWKCVSVFVVSRMIQHGRTKSLKCLTWSLRTPCCWVKSSMV